MVGMRSVIIVIQCLFGYRRKFVLLPLAGASKVLAEKRMKREASYA
jgi:hypothetical protein